MSLPIYRILPHPDGNGWVFTKSKSWRWPSVLRRIKDVYPTWPRAMDAAFEKPDVVTRWQIVWVMKR